jgi:AcrR family transcriptional regulator
MPSRRDRKKLDTRDRILRAAGKLFDEKGFESTTVDEITVLADVSKGTFFNYFTRKEGLLAHVFEGRMSSAEASAREILAIAAPVRDKVVAIYSEAAAAWEEDRALAGHVIAGLGARGFAPGYGARSIANPPARGPEPSTDGMTRWRSLLRRMIEQGQKSGELRPGVSAARAESVLTAVYHDALTRWAGAGEAFNLGEELRAQITLVLDGLAE